MLLFQWPCFCAHNPQLPGCSLTWGAQRAPLRAVSQWHGTRIDVLESLSQGNGIVWETSLEASLSGSSWTWLPCQVIPAVFPSSLLSSELMKWTLWEVANISLTVQVVQQVNTFRVTDETEVLLSSSCPWVVKNKWVKNIRSKYIGYCTWQPLCQRICPVELIAALNVWWFLFWFFFSIPFLVLVNFDNKNSNSIMRMETPSFQVLSVWCFPLNDPILVWDKCWITDTSCFSNSWHLSVL